MTQSALDARYGRTPDAGRRARVWGIFVGAFVTVVIIAWLVWGGLLGAPASVQFTGTKSVVLDDQTAQVTWELTVPPGSESQCALQALNESFGIIGWRIIDVPASSQGTRVFTDTVRTSEPARSGLIYRCWLP